jgi:hypothetical protein
MASLATLELRMHTLEARIAELEGGDERTLYAMRRETIGLNLDMKKVVEHLGLTPHTDADIDEVLDQE